MYTFVNPKTIKNDHFLRLPPSSAQEGIKNNDYICWLSSVISLAGSVTDQGCFSRIRDVFPGSRVKKIQNTRIRIKELSFFQYSLNYDPGCSSRNRILIFYPSRIQVQKGTGSAILDFSPVCSCVGSVKSHLKKFDNSISLPFLCNTSKWTFYFQWIDGWVENGWRKADGSVLANEVRWLL